MSNERQARITAMSDYEVSISYLDDDGDRTEVCYSFHTIDLEDGEAIGDLTWKEANGDKIPGGQVCVQGEIDYAEDTLTFDCEWSEMTVTVGIDTEALVHG